MKLTRRSLLAAGTGRFGTGAARGS